MSHITPVPLTNSPPKIIKIKHEIKNYNLISKYSTLKFQISFGIHKERKTN